MVFEWLKSLSRKISYYIPKLLEAYISEQKAHLHYEQELQKSVSEDKSDIIKSWKERVSLKTLLLTLYF